MEIKFHPFQKYYTKLYPHRLHNLFERWEMDWNWEGKSILPKVQRLCFHAWNPKPIEGRPHMIGQMNEWMNESKEEKTLNQCFN
jgi:hypothetical protein